MSKHNSACGKDAESGSKEVSKFFKMAQVGIARSDGMKLRKGKYR